MKRLISIFVFLLLISSISVLPVYAETLDFEGLGSQVGTSYDTLGITFTPNTQTVCGGWASWGIEGTNGSSFLCFNGQNPGYIMELNFTSPLEFISLDVSRSNGSSDGDQFTINAYNGAALLDTQTITFGPINDWTTITINTPGVTRVTWDSSGDDFHPYGVDNLSFSSVVYNPGLYNYYLPYFKAGNGVWTGLALTNRNQGETTQLQVTVYDVSGNPLATENKTIPAHGQDSFVVATHLNNSGWMQVNSHQPVSGLAFLGSWDIPLLMADIPFSSELSSCLIIPHIAQDVSWDTTILICNPNNETASMAIKYVDKAGVEQGTKNYTILANGSGEYLLSTVFSDKIPLEGSIEISSSHGITAFALYTDKKNGGTYYAGINAESCE